MNHRSPNFAHVAALADAMAEGPSTDGPARVPAPVADGQSRLEEHSSDEQLRQWISSGDAEKWRKARYPQRTRAARLLEISERQLIRWESGESFPQIGNRRRYFQFCRENRRRYEHLQEESCPPSPPE